MYIYNIYNVYFALRSISGIPNHFTTSFISQQTKILGSMIDRYQEDCVSVALVLIRRWLEQFYSLEYKSCNGVIRHLHLGEANIKLYSQHQPYFIFFILTLSSANSYNMISWLVNLSLKTSAPTFVCHFEIFFSLKSYSFICCTGLIFL